MFPRIREFFGRVRGSVSGFLNPEELYRSIITALGSGSTLGLALTLANAAIAHAAVIFPNPIAGALATMLLTLVVDLLRRLDHGDKAKLVLAVMPADAPDEPPPPGT